MKQPFLAIVAAAALAGCSSGPSTLFANVTGQPACAPNDGPAIQLNVPQAGADGSTLRVTVYRSQQEADGKTWSVAPPHEFGIATLCRGGSCENASSGEVRFAAGSLGLRGTVDLRFPTRGRLRGVFDAAWLEIAAQCG